jgi:hypothetical protein
VTQRLTIAAVGVFLAACLGCTGYQLEPGEPDVELTTTSLDFGDVQRGLWRERSLAVQNQGNATLHVTDYALQDGSSDAFYFDDPIRDILPGMYAELIVRYTPTHEGGDAGAILVRSDDPDQPEMTIFLQGTGVIPRCEVEPELLYYPIAEGSQSLCFTVRSVGSGALTVASAELEEGTTDFALSFPAGYEPPFSLDAGLAIEVTVTYDPTADTGSQDRVLLTTDDPDLFLGQAAVDVIAAGEDPNGDNHEPLVEIVSPPDGGLSLEGEPLTLVGLVADVEEDPPSLGILWHSSLDGYLTGSGADEDGNVELTTDALTPGPHLITLKAFDAEGAEGTDAISLIVYQDDDELEYTLAGGDTPYHYFHVDDDLTVEVNGTPIFVDADGHQDHHPPLSFYANPGDTLRVVATDSQHCTKALVGLVLHVGNQYQQVLTSDISASACEDHDDYDPSYDGPWPNDFLDQDFLIQIP